MSFHMTRAGRACLLEWDAAVLVDDILGALVELRHARTVADAPLVVLLHFRLSVPFPSSVVRDSLRAALPAILASTANLLVAVDGSGGEREAMRMSLWTVPRNSTLRTAPITFSSLDQALEHAQSLAPQDVLALRRMVLEQARASRRGGRCERGT
jgi:hypothetical protein